MIRTVIRFNAKKMLLASFVALGPLGNILTPYFFPNSFRAYYLLLPLFPLFFVHAREKIAKIGILFLPLLIYCCTSAILVENFGTANEPHTLFRFFLLFCQFFFVLGAASTIRDKEEIIQVIKTYLTFYFISLAIGYLFFFGYYLKIIPFSLIDRFSILAQFGFGLLRFSPGSYPNEYGIVSSFVLSILTLLFLEGKNSPFSIKWLRFFFLATFLAFLLTTTRAAYLSYFVSLLYLTWKSGNFMKAFVRFSLFFTTLFSVLLVFKLNMFRILSAGFSQRINEGSLGERYFIWQGTIEQVKGDSFLGEGFASLTNIHNVYLQLFFELGLIGTALFLGTLFFTLIETFYKYKRPLQDEISLFLRKIRTVGLINILSFAASNHNLNHHLTWFVLFLCLACLHQPLSARLPRSFNLQNNCK